jgi:hypothetical protein
MMNEDFYHRGKGVPIAIGKHGATRRFFETLCASLFYSVLHCGCHSSAKSFSQENRSLSRLLNQKQKTENKKLEIHV